MIELGAIAVLQSCQTLLTVKEHGDRLEAIEAARAAATQRGRPLLNVGCASTRVLKHPCGDVCVDLDPRRLARCRSRRPTVADVRQIPYPDGYFGAVVACHVLEHLPTVDDGRRAFAELRRVAGHVWICSPSRFSIVGWLVPDHHLWVHQAHDGTITFEQRRRGEQHGELWHPLLRAYWEAKDSLEIAIGTAS